MSRTSDKLRDEIMSGKVIACRWWSVIVAGYFAKLRGKSRQTCPYVKSGGWWATYWRLGWDNADNDRRGGT